MAKLKSTKPMSITLLLDGKKKTITQNGVTVGGMRKIMKYYKEMEQLEDGDTVNQLEMIDKMIVLITELFNDPRVDFESIENSILLEDLAPLFQDIVGAAMGVGEGEEPKKEKKN